MKTAIGQTIVEITQDDWDEVTATSNNPETRTMSIYLHLSGGNTIKFEISKQHGFWYDGFTG